MAEGELRQADGVWGVGRYARLLHRFWSAAIAVEMEYRANFVVACLTSAFTLGSALLTLALVYQHGYEMGGWGWEQALIVVGLYTVLDGIQATVFAPNRTRVTELVREGTLDFVLLKPVDSQFWLSLRTFSPWGLPSVLLGVAILVYGGQRVGLGVLDYAKGLPVFLLGVVILYSVGYALATLTIWFIKLFNITMAMSALLEAGKYPVSAYPGAYRVFFTAVLPVAFMTTVPAELMLGLHSGWRGPAGAAGLALLFFGFSRWFWRFALRSYTSASS